MVIAPSILIYKSFLYWSFKVDHSKFVVKIIEQKMQDLKWRILA